MLALCMLLWAASGSGIGRSIAAKMAGGKSRWHAALLLAGDGSKLHGALMSETSALLKDEQFSEAYRRCIARSYKANGHRISCQLSMLPLRYGE